MLCMSRLGSCRELRLRLPRLRSEGVGRERPRLELGDPGGPGPGSRWELETEKLVIGRTFMGGCPTSALASQSAEGSGLGGRPSGILLDVYTDFW